MPQWEEELLLLDSALGEKSNTDSHAHRDSSVVKGFHTNPVSLQPLHEEGGT